jgi:hypothetical protein
MKNHSLLRDLGYEPTGTKPFRVWGQTVAGNCYRTILNESSGLVQDVVICENKVVLIGTWLGPVQSTKYVGVPADVTEFIRLVTPSPCNS